MKLLLRTEEWKDRPINGCNQTASGESESEQRDSHGSSLTNNSRFQEGSCKNEL